MPDLALRNDLLERARSLGPLLRASADEIDRARQLPAHIVQAMKDSGVFRMSVPASLGGFETDSVTLNLVIEEVSSANGSAGWCLMIGMGAGAWSAQLEDDVWRGLFPNPDSVLANAILPPGRARPVDGGFVVSGRWPFASGITHSDVVSGAAVIEGDTSPGPDRMKIFFAPKDQAEVFDNWNTSGLQGTGSRDFALHDVFVPSGRVAPFGGAPRRAGALYRAPNLLNHFGVPLGIAKRAVEAYIEAMRDKPGKFGAASRDEPYIQIALAEGSAIIGASRAYAFTLLERIWATVEAGDPVSEQDRVEWRIANAFVHDSCAKAIEILQHAAGSKAVYLPNDLDRCFRDIHTARQHGIVAGRVYDQGGRAMLGGPMPPSW